LTDEQIFAGVQGVFADLFQLPADAITRETSQPTLADWDSMQHLNVILALEETFALAFDPEDMERMTSVTAIAAVIRRKQAGMATAGVHTL
jgi:acyl carrier protein